MEEVVVTRLWMGGVVLMMLAFAAIAIVGHYRQKGRSEPKRTSRSAEG